MPNPKSRQLTLMKAIATSFLLIVFASVGHAQLFHKNKTDSTKVKKVKLAGIPMLNYNRSYGFMYGAMGQAFYKVSKTDTVSPTSSTMVMGMYSTSNTAMVVGVQKLFLNEDRWRIKVVGGYGDMFFQYFQELPNLPPALGQYWDGGKWIDYENEIAFAVIDVKRMVIKNLYVGPSLTGSWATTTFDINNPITGEQPSKVANMMSLGYGITYDSRDNVNYPVLGYFVDFKNKFNNEAFGATSDFVQFEISANYFWDLFKNQKSILVPRIHADVATGDVPFQGQSYMGRDDLRGYSLGEFRGNQLYDAQVEWRQVVYKRFGMVGFVGLGKVMDSLSEFGDAQWLPGGGIGFRYRMIKSERINIGIDAGVGKDDWSLTFRIGESFGR